MNEFLTTEIEAELDASVEVSTPIDDEESESDGYLTLRILERGHVMEAMLVPEGELITALEKHLKRI